MARSMDWWVIKNKFGMALAFEGLRIWVFAQNKPSFEYLSLCY